MTITQKTAICLMKSAITGQPESLPEGYRMRDVQQLMIDQGALTMGYIGALNCGFPAEKPLMQYLLDQYCVAVLYSERQLHQIESICKAFDENGFDYMPVKGAIMKYMYPSHELRGMSDADILIREEQYPQIRPVMEALGFTETGESDHEHIWQNDHLNVELHKRLMPTYHKDYYSYFGEGWDLAKIRNGCRWAMTEEDAFIYSFIHFAKHYRDSEAHCRFVTDLWVHMRSRPDMDMEYIRQQMEQMRMGAFYENILRVIDAWFEGGEWDDKTVRITQVLFNDDEQEKKDLHTIAQDTRVAQEIGSAKQLKRTRLLQKMFPTREHMDWSYPQWKKLPLPIAWVLRWFCLLFFRRDVVKSRSEEKNVTEQDIENYRQDLEYVGLEFSDGVALPD